MLGSREQREPQPRRRGRQGADSFWRQGAPRVMAGMNNTWHTGGGGRGGIMRYVGFLVFGDDVPERCVLASA